MSELTIAFLAGFIGMVGWGLSDFFSSLSMHDNKLSPARASFWLYVATSLMLWIFILTTGQKVIPLDILLILEIVFLAFLNVVSYLLFFNALKIGNLGTVSTIFSTYAVGGTLVSVLFFGEHMSIARLGSLLLIFFGIAGVSIQNPKNFSTIKGFLPAITGAGLLSILFPLLDQVIGASGGAYFIVAILGIFTAVQFFIYIILTEGKIINKKITLRKNGIAQIFTAGVASAFANIAVAWGLESTSLTSVVIVLSSAIPLVSVTLGYLFFKERLTKIQYAGIVTIIFGTGILLIS